MAGKRKIKCAICLIGVRPPARAAAFVGENPDLLDFEADRIRIGESCGDLRACGSAIMASCGGMVIIFNGENKEAIMCGTASPVSVRMNEARIMINGIGSADVRNGLANSNIPDLRYCLREKNLICWRSLLSQIYE